MTIVARWTGRLLSIAGLAAWLIDHDIRSYELIARIFDGQDEGLSRDDVLDNITLYWLTGTAVSSARLYWENRIRFFEPLGVTAPVAAIQFIDTCLGGICVKVREYGGVMMVTSTHGNCEEMLYADKGEPNPSNTLNPVPFHYVDDAAAAIRLNEGGSLSDIAPTILGVLNIDKPAEMTGTDIRSVKDDPVDRY